MKKTAKIGEIEVVLESSGDIPRMYRKIFGQDIIVQMTAFQLKAAQKDFAATLAGSEIEMFENLAWTLAKHADPEIPDIDEWLRQFEALDILEAIPVILDMWIQESKTTSKLKKKNAKLTDK